MKRRFQPRKKWTMAGKANSTRFTRRRIKGVAIHWNGPPVPRSALKDPRHYLEGVRRFHVHTRRWSDIAYNLAVDSQGRIWDLRGLSRRSAANGSVLVNEEYIAILAILGEGQKPTPEMLVGIRKAVRRVRRRYPWRARKVVTHSDIRPLGTECPGPQLTRHVRAGTFQPRALRKMFAAMGYKAKQISRLLKG